MGIRDDQKRLRSTAAGAGVVGLALLLGVALGVVPGVVDARAQEWPDVHTGFAYGTLPFDRPAEELLSEEDTRRLIVALSHGWSVDKYVKETGARELDVLTLMDDLEDEVLIRGDSDYDMRPAFPVFRQEDLETAAPVVSEVGRGLAGLIEEHWSEIDEFVESLEARPDSTPGEFLYRVVVGGVLFGGMLDVLHDDQTLVPSPPRRAGRSIAFYAWMTEGESAIRPLVYHVDQVGRHSIHSIGPVPPDQLRVEIAVLAETDPVFEDADSGRWRIFASVFSRDILLPYLKSQRSKLLEAARDLNVGRYTAFGEFVAWTYAGAATEAARILAETGRIEPPREFARYALRLGR